MIIVNVTRMPLHITGIYMELGRGAGTNKHKPSARILTLAPKKVSSFHIRSSVEHLVASNTRQSSIGHHHLNYHLYWCPICHGLINSYNSWNTIYCSAHDGRHHWYLNNIKILHRDYLWIWCDHCRLIILQWLTSAFRSRVGPNRKQRWILR